MTHRSAPEASIDIRDVWKDRPGKFPKAALPGAGFSFKYEGETVGPTLSSDWRYTVAHDAQSGIFKGIFAHESGLVVTREMRVITEFNAVEFKLHFKNVAKQMLSPLSAIEALNITFGEPADDGNCVISSGGGLSDGYLPPRSFAIRRQCFAPTVADTGMVELTTEGGWSSNKDLPFFFVQNDRLQEGIFVALGWSGQWAASVQRDPARGAISVTGRIPELEIALQPGEEIAGPTVLLGIYNGALAEGSNLLRRLIRDVYTPKLAGETFLPIALYDSFWNIGVDFDESLLMRLAEGAASIHQEYFLLDAGWYAGTGKGFDFSCGVGNWYEIDKSKLPNGLAPIADYVRSKGLKFGLWFEPERVAPTSQLAKEHPDWVLWKHEKEPESFHRELNKNHGLLDYGRPEVRQWVRELLDRYIRDYEIKFIRYDFNIAPLPYWDANDKAGRRGITQLRHIQGFYSVIDWIRKRHPDTVLEGCASGGRRIDLETARRFHTFLISDYNVDPSIIRFHLFGINHFLPGNYHYVEYTQPAPHQQDFKPDDLGFQSLFGGAFGTGGRVDLWSEQMREKARLHVQTWKKLRRYLIEDYYPLSAQPADLESWSGWQFHDPKDQSGFIQTFRTKTSDATHRFLVHGLDARTRYRFSDAYTAEVFDMTGVTATTEGIEVTQPPVSSRVFTYRRIPA